MASQKNEKTTVMSVTPLGSYPNNSDELVPNTYIITYINDEFEEITLYGPYVNNNYITDIVLFINNKTKKTAGSKTKHYKKRKDKSKTRKRRKSKKAHK
jgi:hypothetical protein